MAQQGQQQATWLEPSFKEFEQRLNGGAEASIHQVRKTAFQKLSEQGFPTRKHEDWKYTSLQPLLRTNLKLAAGGEKLTLGQIESVLINSELPRAVFVDGAFAADLSLLGDLESGLKVCSLAEVLGGGSDDDAKAVVEKHLGKYAEFSEQALVALNTAFVQEGLFIHVAKGQAIETPLQIVFVTTAAGENTVSYPRLLLVSEESSQVSLVETHLGLGENTYFTNVVAEAVVAENAIVDHYKIQLESEQAFHYGKWQVQQAASSNFSTQIFSFGGRIVRNEIDPVLNGEGIESTMNGLTVLSGEQHIDNHTVIDHAMPHCESSELFKGIYGDKSRGVFSGTIVVRQDAQKTNAFQANNSLLLSDDAGVDTQPQLKIFADDVRCSHGATIGQLDEEALFYLRSRGIPQAEARKILIRGFAAELLEGIKIDAVRDSVESLMNEKLAVIL